MLHVAPILISIGATKPPTHPEDGNGVPETSENLHVLTRLPVGENFIEIWCV